MPEYSHACFGLADHGHLKPLCRVEQEASSRAVHLNNERGTIVYKLIPIVFVLFAGGMFFILHAEHERAQRQSTQNDESSADASDRSVIQPESASSPEPDEDRVQVERETHEPAAVSANARPLDPDRSNDEEAADATTDRNDPEAIIHFFDLPSHGVPLHE